ncbi:interferon-inducible GTPase 5-like [Halichoeres trimaculatus]|uniref:interferon-inducible GTPase 5-like n=1 Tax=Halichoeres trimaculatus TaxID=147232 RepID=UPI003D9EBA8D
MEKSYEDEEYKDFQEEVRAHLQNSNMASAAAKIQEFLEKKKNIHLNIAITGETGSGKSTFVNAIRGVDNWDERAAPTGVKETTMAVTPYLHPNFPNVTFSDLPGVGTMAFPAARYLKLVGFEKFDFFIIISADRFTENDVKLAKDIQRMKKKFYFIRSKIDQDINNESRCQRGFSEERTLTQIRINCVQGLRGQGFKDPQVFLVSSFDLPLYDFALLAETLERELPEHKKEAFLFAMPNISLEVIKKKKKAFHSNIKYLAALSAAVAAAPVPGLSASSDAVLLAAVVTRYVIGFGLDIPSLQRLSNCTGIPLDELFKVIKSPLAVEKVTFNLMLKLLAECANKAAALVGEEASKFIPFIGIPVAMTLSFTTTYKGLSIFLDMLAADAQRVFERSLGQKTKG